MRLRFLKQLYWTSKILAIFLLLLVSLFTIDILRGDYLIIYTGGAWFTYVVAACLMTILILITWKKELAGGIFFSVLGIACLALMSDPRLLRWPMAAMFLLAGLLYFLAGYLRKKTKQSKKKGFTLIEFLVVIFIIGILASIANITFAFFKTRADDLKRVSDLKKISEVLSQYYRDNGFYPPSLPADTPLLSPDGSKSYFTAPTNPDVKIGSVCPDQNYQYINLGYDEYRLVGCLERPYNDLPAGGVVLSSDGSLTSLSVVKGLVGYWPFEEKGGTVVHDFSGLNNNGEFFGAGQQHFIQDSGEWVATFNGLDDNIVVASQPNLNLNSMTFTAWIKPGEITGHNYILEKGSPSQYGVSLHKGQNSGELDVFLDDDRTCGGASQPFKSNTVLVTDQWHFIAFVFDDQAHKVSIYINNNLDGQYNYTACVPANSDSLLIGRSVLGPQGYEYGGLMDDVRLYNRALTDKEILEIYNITKGSR